MYGRVFIGAHTKCTLIYKYIYIYNKNMWIDQRFSRIINTTRIFTNTNPEFKKRTISLLK